jgi:plastocyanin
MIREVFAFTLAGALALAPSGNAAIPEVQIKPHGSGRRDRAYTSTGLEHAEQYAHRFTAPGTYTYFCMPPPHMTATVVVR